MRKIILSVLALVALASCNKDNNEVVNPNAPVAAKFTQGVITRTAGNSWVGNDKIGITMTSDGTTNISESAENIAYKAESSAATSNFVADTSVIYYPQDGSLVDFYTYYPHQATMVNGVFKVDVSSGVEANIDLLRAVATDKSKTDSEVVLNFSHRLSRLTMNITRGAGISTNAITANLVGSNTKADYNIYTDQFSNETTVANVPISVDGLTASVILVPQTMGADAKVVFTIDGENYNWSIDAKTFVKSKNHVYNITIQKTGIVVNGSTITDWTTSNGGSEIAN